MFPVAALTAHYQEFLWNQIDTVSTLQDCSIDFFGLLIPVSNLETDCAGLASAQSTAGFGDIGLSDVSYEPYALLPPATSFRELRRPHLAQAIFSQ